MEVAGVHAEVCPHGSDLVAAFDLLAEFYLNFIEVAVEGIDVFYFSICGVTVGVADDDDVSPAFTDVMGEGDDAVRAGVDGVSEIGVPAAAAVPVLAEVGGGAEPQAACFVIAGGIWLADGEVEAVCNGYFYACVGGGEAEECEEEGDEGEVPGENTSLGNFLKCLGLVRHPGSS